MLILLAAIWNSVHADLFVLGRMLASAMLHPLALIGDMLS